jgi:hypothetical protein
MRIQVMAYPSIKVFEGIVDPNQSVRDILTVIQSKSASQPVWQRIKPDNRSDEAEAESESESESESGPVLIVDRNQYFHRMPVDDEVNKYYDGKAGEMYRIRDHSSTRYRIVTPPISMPKDKQKSKVKQVTGILYASAYDTLLVMLADRGCDADILGKFSIPRAKMLDYYESNNISGITIPDLSKNDILVNHRDHAVYVVFISPDIDVMTSRRYSDLKTKLSAWMDEIINHYNRITGSVLAHVSSDDIDEDADGGALAEFTNKIEIIIVYNNDKGGTEMVPDLKHKFYQAFPVQNLSFNVTKHIEQPVFTMLNSIKDRAEIRNMYAINGRTLASDETLASYGLREGVRLMLV